ncbi:Os11g0663700 [Oryza sativa Japonica Group]|uniref:Os11g0663700 protein n=1 Tax=Oryza sativa subsp. japonica TaxID=39947 RepID=A0A0N7KTB5_ORYSJ|nr:Os11g0663700 [Oryza sativa Japonica Group]
MVARCGLPSSGPDWWRAAYPLAGLGGWQTASTTVRRMTFQCRYTSSSNPCVLVIDEWMMAWLLMMNEFLDVVLGMLKGCYRLGCVLCVDALGMLTWVLVR